MIVKIYFKFEYFDGLQELVEIFENHVYDNVPEILHISMLVCSAIYVMQIQIWLFRKFLYCVLVTQSVALTALVAAAFVYMYTKGEEESGSLFNIDNLKYVANKIVGIN